VAYIIKYLYIFWVGYIVHHRYGNRALYCVLNKNNKKTPHDIGYTGYSKHIDAGSAAQK
jgi:hypothetical protein